MGFDVDSITSDDKHFGAFICTICRNLVSLDAVVTSACSHPFCRECLENWVISRVENNRSCSCPTCQQDLAPPTKVQVTGTMVMGNSTRIYAQPLSEAQPLAMKVLRLVQVSCIICDESGAKRWTGDYGNYDQHCNTHPRKVSKTLAALPGADRLRPVASDEKNKSLKSQLLRSHSLPSIGADDAKEAVNGDTSGGGQENLGSKPPRATRHNSMTKKEIKISSATKAPQSPSRIVFNMPRLSQSIGDLNYDHYDVVADLDNDDGPTKLKPLKAFSKPHGPLNVEETKGTTKNGASKPSSTHDDDDRSHPDVNTSSTNATNATNATTNTTSISTATASTAAGTAPTTPKTPNRTHPGDRKTPTSATGRKGKTSKRLDAAGEMPASPETSYGQQDWNNGMSLANLGLTYGTPKERPQTIETVHEDEEFKLELEIDAEQEVDVEENENNNDEKHLGNTEHSISNVEAVELGDKYKKQANAKFNKGDFGGSRTLYSEGLNVMSKIVPVSPEECDLVATLYSNRAVTWFREKKFDSCVRDCNKSLEYDSSHEKSYIRKWRALSALGKFEDAVSCLEDAQKEIPASTRIAQELTKAQEQREILKLVNTMIEAGDLKKARDTIRPLARSSDNISLLLCAAVADAGLGATDSALDKVNKAMKFNPNNLEALELKGYVQFLSGEMEKGCRLLQELYAHNRDNKRVASRMNVCQTTFQMINKGRTFSKKKRHREAAEHITMALEYDSANLPRRSTLYNMLITERSEEYLMCNQYENAYKDINSVLQEFPEDVSAWSLKTDIAISMRKPKIVEEELGRLRKEHDWASRNKVISELYRKARFEAKLILADDDLNKLLSDIATGFSERAILESRCGSAAKDTRRGPRISSAAADITAGVQALMASTATTSAAAMAVAGASTVSERDRKYGGASRSNNIAGSGDDRRRKDRNLDHNNNHRGGDQSRDRSRERSRERSKERNLPDRHKSADMERRLQSAGRSRSRSSDGKNPRRRDRERDRAMEKKFMASMGAIGDFGGVADPPLRDQKLQSRKYNSRRAGQ